MVYYLQTAIHVYLVICMSYVVTSRVKKKGLAALLTDSRATFAVLGVEFVVACCTGDFSCGADMGDSAGAAVISGTCFATSGTTFGGSTHADCIGGGAGVGSDGFDSTYNFSRLTVSNNVAKWTPNQSLWNIPGASQVEYSPFLCPSCESVCTLAAAACAYRTVGVITFTGSGVFVLGVLVGDFM